MRLFIVTLFTIFSMSVNANPVRVDAYADTNFVQALVDNYYDFKVYNKVTSYGGNRIKYVEYNDFRNRTDSNGVFHIEQGGQFDIPIDWQSPGGDFYLSINRPGEYDGECVSLIKELTPDLRVATANWLPGISASQLSEINRLRQGMVIARFHGYDYYPSGNGGHVAVVVKVDSRRGEVVIFEQNYDVDGMPDYAGFRTLTFRGNGGSNDIASFNAVYVMQEQN